VLLYSLGLIEEQLDDVVSAFGVVKEHKQRPVYEPRPLLQRLKRGTHRLNRGRKDKHGFIKNMSALLQPYVMSRLAKQAKPQ